ncbi:MAG TPA: hypothetical protein VGW34_11170 [Allosphingosinicella sp.]|nr:hypothetical protein [Allosphingosinicella sp.]
MSGGAFADLEREALAVVERCLDLDGGARARRGAALERRMLARLSHPGIARILDGGEAAGTFNDWNKSNVVHGLRGNLAICRGEPPASAYRSGS